jgi:peptidoglycan/LPS O-acetylase OafA/YrhL
MRPLPYYKSLDGVRGIAVLMVMLIHNRLLPVGWVGVQVFFVLSGFLITGILVSQTDRPFANFLGRFYWRRGLRIWPLYFLFLVLCGIAYFFLRIPETWNTAWVWLTTFTYNIARISPKFATSDYFDHFWTLCVEEQFYLVWPFVVFLLPLKHFRRLVLLIVLAGPFIRYATGLWLSGHFASLSTIQRGVHSLPTSHLDAFAAGALLAVMPTGFRERIAPKARLMFFVVLLVTVAAGITQSWVLWRHGLPAHWLAFGYDDLQYFHQSVWAYSLLNLTGACLIFCAIEDATFSRLLSFRPLVFVGMISYGLYLWHLPIMHILVVTWPADQHSLTGLVRFAVFFFGTLAVATLSYFGFERHFLRMKKLSFGTARSPHQGTPLTASAGHGLGDNPTDSPAEGAPRSGGD